MRFILGGIALTIAIAFIATCDRQRNMSMAERYPAPWDDQFHLGISRTLIKNSIGGCGELKYRASVVNDNELLVYCTMDGENWIAYQVWPNTGEVTGPVRPDPSLD